MTWRPGMIRRVGELTLVDAALDLFDDHVEVDVVHVEAGSLINEASPNLLEVDRLASAVPLYYVLLNRSPGVGAM